MLELLPQPQKASLKYFPSVWLVKLAHCVNEKPLQKRLLQVIQDRDFNVRISDLMSSPIS